MFVGKRYLFFKLTYLLRYQVYEQTRMIDRLRDILIKIIWLKPLFYIGSGAATIFFVYIVFLADEPAKEVYVIPCIVIFLWSLSCSLLLSFFPHVPRKPKDHQSFLARLKIRLIRAAYWAGFVFICCISALVVWLTLRMLNVWYAEF